MRKARDKSAVPKLLLIAVFISLVFMPLLRMFMGMDRESIQAVLSSESFWPAVVHSMTATVIATVITILFALLLAFSIERTNICGKQFFRIVAILPMLIPSISCGMGLVLLFGNNGILTNLLHLGGTIYGLHGIVIGSVIYAFPVAYLMFADIIRYEDMSPYEAAELLGISRLRRFTAITLPYLRKPLVRAIFSTFTLIITDYGVPLMVGGKYTTIPVIMYSEVIGQLNFDKGAVYGSLLLLPAVSAFIIDLLNKDRDNMAYVTRKYESEDCFLKRAGSYICCVLEAVITLLPILSFVILAFAREYPNDLHFTMDNVVKAFQLRAGPYMMNSVKIALSVSLTGTAFAFAAAYFSARMRSGMTKILHLLVLTSAAVPGVVLGLSYVLAFKGTAIYGTVIILILVNVIHFISSPYLMMYNFLSKLNRNLEAVAQTLSIGRFHLIKDIVIPQCRGTLLEMFSYFFVNCMMTISAVSFLATSLNRPISLMINQFEAQTQLECAAVVSLMILTVNLAVRLGIQFLKKTK